MADNNRGSPLLPISGVIALFAALGVIIFTQQVPLKGTRPYVPEVQEQPEKVRARLWQDPFLAVMEHVKTDNVTKSKLAELQNLRNEFNVREVEGKITILGVMVFGAPYAEESELRMRHRYAVLSGLNRLGFVPEDLAYIKYVENPVAEKKTPDVICMSNILPYEWLEKNSEEGKEHVLLLWFNDDTFQEKPLSKLARLIDELPKSSKNTPVKIIGPAGSKTLFEMLRELWDVQEPMPKGIQIYSATASVADSLLLKQSGKGNTATNISIEKAFKDRGITFKRTILTDDELAKALIYELGRRGVNFQCGQDHIVLVAEWDTFYGRSLLETFETVLKERFSHFCVDEFKSQEDEFKSQEKDVKRLCEAIEKDGYELGTISASRNTVDWLNKVLEVPDLFEKLENKKQPDLTKEIKKLRDQTSEIRKMTFDKLTEEQQISVKRLKEEQQISVKRLNRLMIEVSYPDETPKKDEFLKKSLYRFSYLRGIDGKLPGEQDQDSKKQEKKDSANKEDIGSLEQPTGKGQYDYLRRLAEKIYSLDQGWKLREKGSVKAIGVLGSDFYDKYLVLQALRQQLPEITYFTTDIDARMLYADNIKWTRNLVVASSFGLQLRDRLQKDVPPFRDNYQTSVFYATLESFREKNEENDSVLRKSDNIKTESPRIFEIGRKEAFDLTPDHKNSSIHPYPSIYKSSRIKPNWEKYVISDKKYVRFLLAMFFFFFSLLYLTSTRFKDAMKCLWRFIRRNIDVDLVLLVVLVLLVYLFYKKILNDPEEEPFSILAGVSVWPTEIVRIIVFLLSWYFIISAIDRLRRNSKDLAKDFGIGGELIEDKSSNRKKNNLIERRKSQFSGLRKWLVSFVNRFIESLVRPGKASAQWKDKITYNWWVGDKEKTAPMDDVWREYMNRGKWNYILSRTILILLAYLYVGSFIIYLFGRFGLPTSPVRGNVSSKIDNLIMVSAVVSFLILTFYVFDTTRLCQHFVVLASRKKPIWSPTCLKKFMIRSSYGSEGAVGEWMVVQLIARRTDVVGRLIFRPFIVWFLLLVSRNSYFDNWITPIGLAIVISMSAVYAWTCALILRGATEKAREAVICRLSDQLVRAASSEKSPNKEQKERIEFVLSEVRSIQRGAFAPFMRHPAVQALFVPFGGIGGLALLEQLLEKLNL